MSYRLALSIAGIQFTISCRLPFLPESPKDPYRAFHRPAARRPDPGIAVTIATGRMPRLQGLEKVFEADDTWAMFRGRRGRVIRGPVRAAAPFWAAVISSDWRRVSLTVSPRLVKKEEGGAGLMNPFRYPLDQIVLTGALAQRQGVILHCCGAALKGRGLVCPARSGGGKTTLSRLLAGQGRFRVMSDDRMIVRKTAGALRCWGTPWPGAGGMALNESAPLEAVFFLVKGPRHRITRLAPAEAFQRLLPMASVPWYDKETFPAVLSVCEEITRRVPCRELQFRPEADVAELVARGVADLRPPT